jgi:16S rRNA (guanine966-N2)-methyltransferase
MLDRVREALFGTLGARVEEASVLDLFAGTGSLAFECLSRGAKRALVVESDARARNVLEANARELGVEDRLAVRMGDALAPSSWWPPGSDPKVRWADLAFLDPPYEWVRGPRRHAVLEALEEIGLRALSDGGLIVLHAPRSSLARVDFPDALDARERGYGTSSLWYLTPASRAGSEGVEPRGAEAGGS